MSVGGVLYATFISGDKYDGARGGALAVCASLFAFFGTRNYAEDVYNAFANKLPEMKLRILKLSKTPIEINPIRDMEERINALTERLRNEAHEQKQQNICLTISTFTGTIFWGFGDLFACWAMNGKFFVCP